MALGSTALARSVFSSCLLRAMVRGRARARVGVRVRVKVRVRVRVVTSSRAAVRATPEACRLRGRAPG